MHVNANVIARTSAKRERESVIEQSRSSGITRRRDATCRSITRTQLFFSRDFRVHRKFVTIAFSLARERWNGSSSTLCRHNVGANSVTILMGKAAGEERIEYSFNFLKAGERRNVVESSTLKNIVVPLYTRVRARTNRVFDFSPSLRPTVASLIFLRRDKVSLSQRNR